MQAGSRHAAIAGKLKRSRANELTWMFRIQVWREQGLSASAKTLRVRARPVRPTAAGQLYACEVRVDVRYEYTLCTGAIMTRMTRLGSSNPQELASFEAMCRGIDVYHWLVFKWRWRANAEHRIRFKALYVRYSCTGLVQEPYCHPSCSAARAVFVSVTFSNQT